MRLPPASRGTSPRRLLEELSDPALVVLEDLHWADQATSDVLQVLGRRDRLDACARARDVPRGRGRGRAPAAPRARGARLRAGRVASVRPEALARGGAHARGAAPAPTARRSTGSPAATRSTSRRSWPRPGPSCRRRCATPCSRGPRASSRVRAPCSTSSRSCPPARSCGCSRPSRPTSSSTSTRASRRASSVRSGTPSRSAMSSRASRSRAPCRRSAGAPCTPRSSRAGFAPVRLARPARASRITPRRRVTRRRRSGACARSGAARRRRLCAPRGVRPIRASASLCGSTRRDAERATMLADYGFHASVTARLRRRDRGVRRVRGALAAARRPAARSRDALAHDDPVHPRRTRTPSRRRRAAPPSRSSKACPRAVYTPSPTRPGRPAHAQPRQLRGGRAWGQKARRPRVALRRSRHRVPRAQHDRGVIRDGGRNRARNRAPREEHRRRARDSITPT